MHVRRRLSGGRALPVLILLAAAGPLGARDWIVAPSGGDFPTIQAALAAAQPGDRILVQDKPGGYREALVFPRSGDAAAGPIQLLAFPGHRPAVDGTGVAADQLVLLENRSWITIQGLEIRNLANPGDAAGIVVRGAGSHIEIRNCDIHDIAGRDAFALVFLGTSTISSLRDIVVDGNHIHDCVLGTSEALSLNGNVEAFAVTGNRVHDVSNIGIDFIGGEAWVNPVQVARNGVCRGNVVERANSAYGGGVRRRHLCGRRPGHPDRGQRGHGL